MNDNRYKTKLHVSSETRKGSGDDTNEFRFDLPNGVSHLKKVTIAEAEIVNSMTPIHPGNHKVYFNEFDFFVEHAGTATEMTCVTNPRLHFTSTMYEGNIPHANYDLDSMMEATSTAMNTAVAVWDSLGQTLAGLPCLNHYTVTRPPASNSLLPIIMATPFTKTYSDQTQLFDEVKMHETNFAVRRGNLPTQTVTGFGTWNPYNKNPTDGSAVTHSTAANQSSITNLMHCSPYRVVMNVSKLHQFIPGDPVSLSFDEIATSSGEVTLQQSQGLDTVNTTPVKISTIDGFVGYVNDTELHVLVKGFSSKTLVLQNCVLRLNNGISEFQKTGCVNIGLGQKTRQGLLVSSRVLELLGTSKNVRYDARVHANAATDYMAFKDSTNPFAGGGTTKVLGTSQGRLAPSSTRFIFFDTNVGSTEITLGDVSSLNVDDRVIYECSSTSGKITALTIGTQYFIQAIDTSNDTITLKESPGEPSSAITLTQPSGSAQHSILIAPFKLTNQSAENTNAYTVLQMDTFHFLQNESRVLFSGLTGNDQDALAHKTIKIIETPASNQQIPRIAFEFAGTLETTTFGNLIWSMPYPPTHSTVEFSGNVDTSNNKFTISTTNLSSGDKVMYRSISMPVGGLVNGRTYFIINKTGSDFQLSEKSGGTAVNLTSTGDGMFERHEAQINLMKIGHPHVIGTENVDLTRNGRVAFIELEAVGIGPIGDLHLAGSDRTYFGRCQLDAGYLALTLNNDSVVGEYEFDNFVKPREMVIRLYDEKGEPLKTMGTHNSFLLELEGVGTYSGCR